MPLSIVLRRLAARLKRQTAPPSLTMRLLIVDDEQPVLHFVERVLREAGYQTAVAADGAEALNLVARLGEFDMLVTDMMMPGMNGAELARRLRQSQPGLKVLYLTGFSDKLFEEKVMLWDDEAFLDKPSSAAALRQAVSLLLFRRFETDVPAQICT